MKKILKNFTLFQKILLLISIVVQTVCAFVINSVDGWFAWASCMTFAIYLVYNANSKYISFVWIIVSYAIYIYFNIKELYWGEFATSVISIVINFVAMLNWKKHTKDNHLEINKLGSTEILLSFFSTIAICVVSYFVLKTMNTELIILNSMSIAVIIIEYYFTFRRSFWKFFYGIFAAIIYILMWIFAMKSITDYALLFVVNGFINIVWYIDGIVEWQKIIKEKDQNYKQTKNK